MDIQAVIVSIDELNKTKNAIANAIRGKGVTSQGRFATFPNEINAIQASSGDYQNIVSNLYKNNIFKQKNKNEMEPVGLLQDTFENVKTNVVKIYSLYDIENVKIADGPYKARVNQTPFKAYFNLMVDKNAAGLLGWNTLALSIQPKESENPNGSVVIKYTTNGEEHNVTMPVQDWKVTKPDNNDHSKNVYWLAQDIFNPDIDNKDLRQLVGVKDANNGGATFYGRFNAFQTYTSRPAIFDKLDTVAGYNTVDAVLTLNKNGSIVETIPVKLARNIFGETIPLNGGGNGAVLEFDGGNLVFHYSNTDGKLNTKFIISTTGDTSKTDANIVQKIKELKKDPNTYLSIAMHSDGSPITIAEAKAAGML